MKKNLEILVRFFIYTTFFVPLIVVPSSFIFPFIVPKVILLRSLIIAMLAGYILLLFINWHNYKPKFTLLNIGLGLFLLSLFISTFVGVDPYRSFWDNHERMLGLFTLIHYIIYYFVCSSVLKNWFDWQKALKIFLLAGSVVMFIAGIQAVKPDFLLNQVAGRSASTLGNSIYVGGYGLFLMFVSLLLILKEQSRSWKYVEILLGILAFLGLLFSGTRGSLAGLGVAAIVMLIAYTFLIKGNSRIRNTVLIAGLAGLLSIVLLFAFRKTSFVQNIPAVGRTLNTSLSDFSHSPRMIAWRLAVEGWKEKPVFGWGPNNFYFLFNKYYDPRLLESGYTETWFDNAHNIILNTLAVQGVVGLIVYLGIFVVGIISLYIGFKRKTIDNHIFIIGSSFLIAHLIQNITVFENPTSYLYFMFWLAMINVLTNVEIKKLNNNPERVTNATGTDKRVGVLGLGAVGLSALLVIFIGNIRVAQGNTRALTALREIGYIGRQADVSGFLDRVNATWENTTSFDSPHIDDIRNDVTRAMIGLVKNHATRLGNQKSLELLARIENVLKENIALHPGDVRVHLALAEVKEIEANLAGGAKQKESIIAAETYLQDALAFSPRRQQIIYVLSGVKMMLGKENEAIALLEQALKDNSRIGETYWRLAYIYALANQEVKAKETIDLAYKNGIVFNEQEQSIVDTILNPPTSIITTTSSAVTPVKK